MATIHDLKPSITQLPYEEARNLLLQIREARRVSKTPVKQAKLTQDKAKSAVSSSINRMSAKSAEALLKALEALVK